MLEWHSISHIFFLFSDLIVRLPFFEVVVETNIFHNIAPFELAFIWMYYHYKAQFLMQMYCFYAVRRNSSKLWSTTIMSSMYILQLYVLAFLALLLGKRTNFKSSKFEKTCFVTINFYWVVRIFPVNSCHLRVGKFLSRRPTFRTRNLTCAPDRARKKCGPLIAKVYVLGTTRNIVFCSLFT